MTPKRYPAIPKRIQQPGGAVTIRLANGITHSGDECWGLYEPEHRRISIDKTAPKAHQWRTLFHELAHVALIDAGLSNGLEDRLHEAICDAIASARMRERYP